jgi:hypothetical protein
VLHPCPSANISYLRPKFINYSNQNNFREEGSRLNILKDKVAVDTGTVSGIGRGMVDSPLDAEIKVVLAAADEESL